MPKGMTRARGLKQRQPVVSFHHPSAERHDARARVETLLPEAEPRPTLPKGMTRARGLKQNRRLETRACAPKGMTRARGLKPYCRGYRTTTACRKA